MLRERITQLDRLAAIGQLTAGILHEIKNPLNFISNFARLSAELLPDLEALGPKLTDPADAEDLAEVVHMIRDNLTRIRDNGGRAERIVQGMLAQTRAEAAHFEPTDLNGLVEEFAKLAYQGVRAGDKEFNVRLSFELDPAVGQLNLAPYEFNRVILNLMMNACYAVNERRKQQPADSYQPTITVASQRLDGHVDVRIRDNGDGIPEAVKARLFTPFFTTKPVGKGTGLGLSLSRDIVQNLHHGELSVASEPGVYTEFTIRLPADAAGQ
jgi:signal transduction histidine kinase